MDLDVGFTGTRNGMTEPQVDGFTAAMREIIHDIRTFHYGDCIGADDEAASCLSGLREIWRKKFTIVCHPPIDATHRAYNKAYESMYPPMTHFARNRSIVDLTDLLFATPYQDTRQTRGGTWFTIDYARKKERPVVIIWPNGRMEILQ